MARYKYAAPNNKMKQLQQFLNTQGYGLTVDGQAGPATLAAQQHWASRQKAPPLPRPRPQPAGIPGGVLSAVVPGGPGAAASGSIGIPSPISVAGLARAGVPTPGPPNLPPTATPPIPDRSILGAPDISADQLMNPLSRMLQDPKMSLPNPRVYPQPGAFDQAAPMTGDQYPGITDALKAALVKKQRFGLSLTGQQ